MYDDLALFVQLVDIGNYTKAAKILNTTQTTISRRIKHMEQVLGTSLIRRNSRVFELTDQGKFIYQKMSIPIKEILISTTDFKENKHSIQGTLKVALPAALSYGIVSKKIGGFMAQYPLVNLIINYTAQPIDLIRDDFNLAISTSFPQSQNSLVRLIKTFHFNLFASPKFISKYGTPEKPSDLKPNQTIGMIGLDGIKIHCHRATNTKTKEEIIFRQESNLYINNLLHGIQIAKSGDYIIGIWGELISDDIKNGKLIPILPDYEFGEIPCYLIRHNHAITKLESLFIDFLLSCFK